MTTGQMLFLDGLLIVLLLMIGEVVRRAGANVTARGVPVIVFWIFVAVFAPFYFPYARWAILGGDVFWGWAIVVAYPAAMVAAMVWGGFGLAGRCPWPPAWPERRQPVAAAADPAGAAADPAATQATKGTGFVVAQTPAWDEPTLNQGTGRAPTRRTMQAQTAGGVGQEDW